MGGTRNPLFTFYTRNTATVMYLLKFLEMLRDHNPYSIRISIPIPLGFDPESYPIEPATLLLQVRQADHLAKDSNSITDHNALHSITFKREIYTLQSIEPG